MIQDVVSSLLFILSLLVFLPMSVYVLLTVALSMASSDG